MNKTTIINISLKEMLVVQLSTNYVVENHSSKRLFAKDADNTEIELPMRTPVALTQPKFQLSEGGEQYDQSTAISIDMQAAEPFI